MPLLVLLGIVAFLFWIWMLVDCMQREPPDTLEKLTWVLVLLIGSIVGAVIYYVIRKMPRDRSGDTGPF